MPSDLVLFRRWKDTGDVIALFPEFPPDIDGPYCVSYEHVGPHGAANFHGVVRRTLPLTSTEYAGLAEELTRIGYDLKPILRASYRNQEQRRREARRLRQDTSSTGVLQPNRKEDVDDRQSRPSQRDIGIQETPNVQRKEGQLAEAAERLTY